MSELEKQFLDVILQARHIKAFLDFAKSHEMPKNWHLAGACMVQVVWNHQTGKPLQNGINDIDLIYYDSQDLAEEAELAWEERLNHELGEECGLPIDMKNQARVKSWYREKFGIEISELKAATDVLLISPIPSNAIGLTIQNDKASLVAPHGLEDVFKMCVRVNRQQITKKNYEKKISRWLRHWPELTVETY